MWLRCAASGGMCTAAKCDIERGVSRRGAAAGVGGGCRGCVTRRVVGTAASRGLMQQRGFAALGVSARQHRQSQRDETVEGCRCGDIALMRLATVAVGRGGVPCWGSAAGSPCKASRRWAAMGASGGGRHHVPSRAGCEQKCAAARVHRSSNGRQHGRHSGDPRLLCSGCVPQCGAAAGCGGWQRRGAAG